MESIKLSKRLSTIAKYVPTGKKVADIGSDHALLPSYLVLEAISPFAIAGEVNQGPFEAASKQIKGLGLEQKVSVRKGNGLDVLGNNEVDVITIAGMGGSLISEILEAGKEKLRYTERLVLQPNVGSEFVRKWLDLNNWNIIAEDIIEEEEKIYEVIVAEPRRNSENYSYQDQDRTKDDLFRLGPFLWQEKSEILTEKWKKEYDKNKYILKQLEKSEDIAVRKIKEGEINKEIKWIMGVLECLEKGKI